MAWINIACNIFIYSVLMVLNITVYDDMSGWSILV